MLYSVRTNKAWASLFSKRLFGDKDFLVLRYKAVWALCFQETKVN